MPPGMIYWPAQPTYADSSHTYVANINVQKNELASHFHECLWEVSGSFKLSAELGKKSKILDKKTCGKIKV